MRDTLSAVSETGPNQDGRRNAPGPVPHTQVHSIVRRTLENFQDAIAFLLTMRLLVLSVQALGSSRPNGPYSGRPHEPRVVGDHVRA